MSIFSYFNFFTVFRGHSRSIYALFIARIVTCCGNFVFPFLTLYLTSVQKLSPEKAGAFLLITSAACAVGATIGGSLADSWSRKKMLITGICLSATAYILTAFAGNTNTACILLLLGAAANTSAEPALNALIADHTEGPRRANAFSLLYLGFNLGFAVAPVMAGFLFEKHLRILFLGDALASLLAVLVILNFVTDKKTEQSADEKQPPDPRPFWKIVLSEPICLSFAAAYAVYVIVYSQAIFGLPIQLDTSFGAKGAKFYGALMSFNGLCVLLLTPLIVRLSSGIKPLTAVATGGVLYALGFGAYAFLGGASIYAFWLLVPVWSAGEILAIPNAKTYIADASSRANRGRLNVLLDYASEAGYALGPLLGGWCMKLYGLSTMWVLAGFAVMASVVFIRFFISKQKNTTVMTLQPGRNSI